MAAAVLTVGVLRMALPPELRLKDAPWAVLAVLTVLVIALMIGDPGRIDRPSRSLRMVTEALIAVITIANGASSISLVLGIFYGKEFTQNPHLLLTSGAIIWITNVVAFGLWYWDLDRGGAAARSVGSEVAPAFVFPEMSNPGYVGPDWTPSFVDYLHLSFSTATAFSPTDVSAIKPWAKVLMMIEEAISLTVGILVVARAVNLLR
jgi:uncharacterized membrane protein